MRLNNKGFVSSALLYSLLLLFLALILSLLSLLSNRKMILDKLKKDIKSEINQINIYNYYENGTEIYYNPVTGKICSDYNEENSKTGIKEGCLKWYIFNDHKNSSVVNMILDHNTTDLVAYNSSGTNTSMKEIKEALESDTENWKQTARIISADEIAEITGIKDALDWTSDKTFADNPIKGESISWFYLDGSDGTDTTWHTQIAEAQGVSKYAWLFDNTNECTSYGCNVEDLSTYGYWTSTSVVGIPSFAWYVNGHGLLDYGHVSTGDRRGVRPVITLSKKKVYIQYKEEILNGADPVLSDNLIPVVIENDGTVTKADLSKEWYKYEDKKWANAVILKDETKTYNSEEKIEEENIKQYYVWIPKYAYKLWNVDSDNTETKEKPIEITFGSKAKTTGTNNGDTYIHPAFTNFDTNGIWVGKFEISYDEETYTDKTKFLTTNPNYASATEGSKVLVKPNVRSLTNKNVSGFYKLLKATNESLNSHMMTNMEWGAAAYLTYSKYGRCDSSTCTEVTINNVNTGYYGSSAVFTGQWEYSATITGCAADTVSASVQSNKNECVNKYNSSKGYLASTTGNITGIYDMSGGSWEYVMGVIEDADGNLYSGRNSKYNSGFKGLYGCPTCDSDTSGLTSNTTGLNFPDTKYYDAYVRSDAIGTDNWYIYTAGKLGDATKEVANTKLNSTSGDRGLWFNDYAHFATPTYPFLVRGGSWYNDSGAGVFAFLRHHGHAHGSGSARLVLAF